MQNNSFSVFKASNYTRQVHHATLLLLNSGKLPCGLIKKLLQGVGFFPVSNNTDRKHLKKIKTAKSTGPEQVRTLLTSATFLQVLTTTCIVILPFLTSSRDVFSTRSLTWNTKKSEYSVSSIQYFAFVFHKVATTPYLLLFTYSNCTEYMPILLETTE